MEFFVQNDADITPRPQVIKQWTSIFQVLQDDTVQFITETAFEKLVSFTVGIDYKITRDEDGDPHNDVLSDYEVDSDISMDSAAQFQFEIQRIELQMEQDFASNKSCTRRSVIFKGNYLARVGGAAYGRQIQDFSVVCSQFQLPKTHGDTLKLRCILRESYSKLEDQMDYYSSRATLKLQHNQKVNKRHAILDMAREVLGVSVLKSQDCVKFAIYYGAWAISDRINNNQFPVRKFMGVLNDHARAIVVPELNTSSTCYECIRKGLERRVLRTGYASVCRDEGCQVQYHADELGAGDIFFLSRSIQRHPDGEIPKAFIPSKFVPEVDYKP
ncbi:hypothetical protein MIR68_008949 [Amoeboaphelidium protococcarum]|nr:hypothetical protein MIR68_008949 [Amoeboaphelidium protococcarum]